LHDLLSYTTFDEHFQSWDSGILDNDSTVVLSFNKLDLLGMAKLGDVNWTLGKVQQNDPHIMFDVRRMVLLCHHLGVMVLKNQPWWLEVAAKLPI
jgi:hypothetical protein